MPEPGPGRRPFDQPGDVGEHRLAVLPVDRPERRRQGREGIVGDLRRRLGQPPEQRALARVRQPDQADVGEQLQPQLDPVGFALGPFLGEARRLPDRGGEAFVAVPAAAALGDDGPLPGSTRSIAAPSTVTAWVPGGTRISRSSPRPRAGWTLRRGRPRSARKCLLPRSAPRSRREGSQTSTTSPPCPPSPPSGPPRGTCASRRKRDAAVPAAAALDPDFCRVVHRQKVDGTRRRAEGGDAREGAAGPRANLPAS